MDVKLFQDSVVYVSALTLDDYNTVSNFLPKALTLVEKDDDAKTKNEVFKIRFDNFDKGSVTPAGISFNSLTEDKHLCITDTCYSYDLAESKEEKAARITESIASIIMYANKLEKQILKAVKDNDKLIEAAKKSVTIVEA